MNTVKRILMIMPSFNYSGGIESFVMNNLRHINLNEFKVDILTHEANAEEYTVEVQLFGGRMFEFPKFTPKNFFEIKRKYIKLLTENQYDIIHCNMANAAFLYLNYAEQKGVPVRILHSHQNKAADTFLHAMRNILLLTIGKKFANQRMACTTLAGDFLFKKKSYDVVRNAIDYSNYQFDLDKRIQIRSELGFSEKDIVIGHTGRLTPQKNQLFLLEILEKLLSRNPNYKLVLVGSGIDREMLEVKVEENKLRNKVFFLGDRSDIPNLLQAFDVFVFPSIYEGLGISILEAQASGLYCLASSGIPEDADISMNIAHLNLKDGSDRWCDAIENVDISKRTAEVVLDPKYDILQNAEVLYNLYKTYLTEET